MYIPKSSKDTHGSLWHADVIIQIRRGMSGLDKNGQYQEKQINRY